VCLLHIGSNSPSLREAIDHGSGHGLYKAHVSSVRADEITIACQDPMIRESISRRTRFFGPSPPDLLRRRSLRTRP
jgi:hypothetical protein